MENASRRKHGSVVRRCAVHAEHELEKVSSKQGVEGNPREKDRTHYIKLRSWKQTYKADPKDAQRKSAINSMRDSENCEIKGLSHREASAKSQRNEKKMKLRDEKS